MIPIIIIMIRAANDSSVLTITERLKALIVISLLIHYKEDTVLKRS